MSRRAVFIDRDGTMIEEKVYLSDPDGVELLPGTIQALSALRAADLLLVVVTNQAGIGRGLYTIDDYDAVAARLDEQLASHGIVMDATHFCPHHLDVSGPCDCRKPDSGMHRRAAADLDIDLTGLVLRRGQDHRCAAGDHAGRSGNPGENRVRRRARAAGPGRRMGGRRPSSRIPGNYATGHKGGRRFLRSMDRGIL